MTSVCGMSITASCIIPVLFKKVLDFFHGATLDTLNMLDINTLAAFFSGTQFFHPGLFHACAKYN